MSVPRRTRIREAITAAVHLLLTFRWPVLAGLCVVMAVGNASSGEPEWAVVCGIGAAVMLVLQQVERLWERRRRD